MIQPAIPTRAEPAPNVRRNSRGTLMPINIAASRSCTTHRGKFLGYPPTGKYVKVRALVVWHFKGKKLWGETVFFDMGSLLKRIGARISIPRNRRRTKRRD